MAAVGGASRGSCVRVDGTQDGVHILDLVLESTKGLFSQCWQNA